ncbi:unnamed protein product [Vitrella brassicaformis CCMP3155]|uniref:Tectonic-1-3 N-terminal domain-containing protein n=1 Tax=Vitrella brassicaformis (strain CCMP3155) TaxID=1169540 RepID=A0A0G4FKY9_VITBC|nr:unnamed protein product [Vitrella brassicaformis CCMP3155]|eukprot:CEM14427.1 unnamed protein product [Vitrella brassicaformis CCMP3155]
MWRSGPWPGCVAAAAAVGLLLWHLAHAQKQAPIEWDDVEVDSSPSVAIEEGKPLKGCSCDLSPSLCDANCCCDPDCTRAIRDSFSGCVRETLPKEERQYCYARELIHKANRRRNFDVVTDSMYDVLCIEIDNDPSTGVFYTNEERRSTTDLYSIYSDQNVKRLSDSGADLPYWSFKDPDAPYKVGEPVVVGVNVGGTNTFKASFTLPQGSLSGECSDGGGVPVGFLASHGGPTDGGRLETGGLLYSRDALPPSDFASPSSPSSPFQRHTCWRSFSHMGEDVCKSALGPWLNVRLAPLPASPLYNATAWPQLTVRSIKERDLSTGAERVWEQTEVDQYVSGGGPTWETSGSNDTDALCSCTGVVLEVMRKETDVKSKQIDEFPSLILQVIVIYYNTARGQAIGWEANLTVATISDANCQPNALGVVSAAVPQTFAVAFFPTEDTTAPATPPSFPIQRSGNPGYRLGYPLRAGTFTTGPSLNKQAVSLQVDEYGTAGAFLLGIGPNGECLDTSTPQQELWSNRRVIAFGENAAYSCRLSLNEQELSSLCSGDSSLAGRYRLLKPSFDAVGYFGNADWENKADWLAVSIEEATSTMAYNDDTGVCDGSVTILELDFLYAAFGEFAAPQFRIVAAKATQRTGRLRYESAYDPSLKQSFVLSVIVTFARVPDKELKRSVPPRPPLLPSLPDDVFYPFGVSGALGMDGYGMRTMRLWICACIVFVAAWTMDF